MCHGTDGSGQRFPRHNTIQYKHVAINDTRWNTTEQTREQLAQHVLDHTGEEELSDAQLANLLNYILHSWGNSGPVYSPEDIRAVR